MNIQLIVLALCLVCSGCAFHSDVTRLKPFSDYAGQELTLKEPACLIEQWVEPNGNVLLFHLNDDNTFSNFFMSKSKRSPFDKLVRGVAFGGGHLYLTPHVVIKNYTRQYQLWDLGKGCGFNLLHYWGEKIWGTQTALFWTIPAGTPLTIRKVEVSGNASTGPYTTATGRLYLEDQDKDIDFTYNWAAGTNLHRAPWEDETVPKARFIGPKGNAFPQ